MIEELRLARLLEGDAFVTALWFRDQVTSTNDVLRDLATDGAPEGTVVLARTQSAGRGRLGRRWHSAPGLGLYLSVLLRPVGRAAAATRWTAAAAVAACAACRQVAELPVCIKWPNDLLWEQRKLGGILIEMRTIGSRATDLIIGVGINVLQEKADFPGELAARATSLRLMLHGAAPDATMLAAVYLRELGRLAAALRRGAWPEVAGAWETLAPGARGRSVRVICPAGAKYAGQTAGLDAMGALRVRRDDGVEERVRTAETVLPLEVDHAAGR